MNVINKIRHRCTHSIRHDLSGHTVRLDSRCSQWILQFLWPSFLVPLSTINTHNIIKSVCSVYKTHYEIIKLTWATWSAAFTLTLKDLQKPSQMQSDYFKTQMIEWEWYFKALHVKLIWRDFEEGLKFSTGCIVHQKIHRTDVFQRPVCGIPVRQVHAHRLNGGTLGIKRITHYKEIFYCHTLAEWSL